VERGRGRAVLAVLAVLLGPLCAAGPLPAGPAVAAPSPQTAVTPGMVLSLRGTPHLWVAAENFTLHWVGDPQALQGRLVDWDSRVEVVPEQLAALPLGEPWLSAGMVELERAVYVPTAQGAAPEPVLLRVQSIADLQLFGVNAQNYGALVLTPLQWEQRYPFRLDRLTRGNLPVAVSGGVPLPTATPMPPAPPLPPAPPINRPGASTQAPIPRELAAQVDDSWRVSVLSVTPDANAALGATERGFLLLPGQQAVVALILVARSAGDSGRFPVGARLRALAPSGATYGAYLESYLESCASVPDRFPEGEEIPPGGTLSGAVCWQLPAADVPGLLMVHDPPSGSSWPRIFFSLS
jgi:hypothetical protein